MWGGGGYAGSHGLVLIEVKCNILSLGRVSGVEKGLCIYSPVYLVVWNLPSRELHTCIFIVIDAE